MGDVVREGWRGTCARDGRTVENKRLQLLHQVLMSACGRCRPSISEMPKFRLVTCMKVKNEQENVHENVTCKTPVRL